MIRQYESVGTAAYMIDWYKLPGKASLDLIMIINMSAQPRRLTAGGMMDLSRTSYVAVSRNERNRISIMLENTKPFVS